MFLERFKYVDTHIYTKYKMANITLVIPEDLKAELKEHDEVNWSAVIRKALQEHLNKIRIAEAIASKSTLTEKDAEIIARKIKREIAKNHGL